MLYSAHKHCLSMDRAITMRVLSYGLLPIALVALALCDARTLSATISETFNILTLKLISSPSAPLPNANYLAPDVRDPDVFYGSDTKANCVVVYNLRTGQADAFAGLCDKATPGEYVDGVSALDARFSQPRSLCQSPVTGDLFVVDAGNFVVRRISAATGAVDTVVGAAGQEGKTDGTGPDARLTSGTMAIQCLPGGDLLLSDISAHALRRISQDQPGPGPAPSPKPGPKPGPAPGPVPSPSPSPSPGPGPGPAPKPGPQPAPAPEPAGDDTDVPDWAIPLLVAAMVAVLVLAAGTMFYAAQPQPASRQLGHGGSSNNNINATSFASLRGWLGRVSRDSWGGSRSGSGTTAGTGAGSRQALIDLGTEDADSSGVIVLPADADAANGAAYNAYQAPVSRGASRLGRLGSDGQQHTTAAAAAAAAAAGGMDDSNSMPLYILGARHRQAALLAAGTNTSGTMAQSGGGGSRADGDASLLEEACAACAVHAAARHSRTLSRGSSEELAEAIGLAGGAGLAALLPGRAAVGVAGVAQQQELAEGVCGGHGDGDERVQVQSRRAQHRAPDSAMSVYEGSGGQRAGGQQHGQQPGLSLDGRPQLREARSRAAGAADDPFEDLVRRQLGATKGADRP